MTYLFDVLVIFTEFLGEKKLPELRRSTPNVKPEDPQFQPCCLFPA